VTTPAAVNADGSAESEMLLTALIIATEILPLVHRLPVRWLLPLTSAVAAIIVAQASAHGLANAGLTVSELSLTVVIVLVFGAGRRYKLPLCAGLRMSRGTALPQNTRWRVRRDRSTSTRSQQAIVETAAPEMGHDPKSTDMLVRVNVA
jgi:uncharacterized membrane protein YdfJ with MMPL/SSD domain